MEQNEHVSGKPTEGEGGQLAPVQMPEGNLPPGAIRNPCCMGSEAMEMLKVLTGFIEEELADRRQLMALQRLGPDWAGRELRYLAKEAECHAGKLMAACYLISGQSYRPVGFAGLPYINSWCQALREAYHTEACSGLNYARAAEGTADPCLRQLLLQLSQEEYQHTELLMELLRRSLCG